MNIFTRPYVFAFFGGLLGLLISVSPVAVIAGATCGGLIGWLLDM